jgi:transposase InsO family protein
MSESTTVTVGLGVHARSIRLAVRRSGSNTVRTRPYRPRTNGKAERFVRTMLGGWAYSAIYRTSDERRRALVGWLDFYNRRRHTAASAAKAPIERLHALNRNNLLGSYT